MSGSLPIYAPLRLGTGVNFLEPRQYPLFFARIHRAEPIAVSNVPSPDASGLNSGHNPVASIRRPLLNI